MPHHARMRLSASPSPSDGAPIVPFAPSEGCEGRSEGREGTEFELSVRGRRQFGANARERRLGPAPGVVAEFNGPAGSSPDPTKWTLEEGGGIWGGGDELQDYTPRASNVSLDGKGDLVITARKENYGGFPYTSARSKPRASSRSPTEGSKPG